MNATDLDPAVLLDMYRRVVLIRTNDDISVKTLKAGRVTMPYYSPKGQEIIPSAVSVNLTDEDYICTIYRGTHDILAKGMPPKILWAEIAGRVTGSCKGKGGPMHLTYPEKGVMVTTGIVGSSMPIANGLAWASQVRKDGRVTVAYFGDGASNIGAFHEAINMAGVWKLPVVFICQNNLYGEHTKFAKTTAAERIADRAVGYGISGSRVDGNDPLAMYAAAREAIERARNGEGPTLLEAMTFRFQGHVFGDADAYMDKAEKEAAIAADPVPRFRQLLLDEGVATEVQLAEIEDAVRVEISEAVEFALASDFPDVTELRRDVFEHEVAA